MALAYQVTFDNDGVSSYSDYSDSGYTQDDVKRMLHNSSIRKQIADKFRQIVNTNDLSTLSDTSLGYTIECLQKTRFFSKITNIQFYSKDIPFGNIKNGKLL